MSLLNMMLHILKRGSFPLQEDVFDISIDSSLPSLSIHFPSSSALFSNSLGKIRCLATSNEGGNKA